MSDTPQAKTFGSLLKQIRVEDAGIGLRAFAELIGYQPSNLSNLERSRAKPPASHKKLMEICNALGLGEHEPKRQELIDLAAQERNAVPGDVEEAIKAQPGIPVLVRTVQNKQLDEEKLNELTEYIKTFY